MTNRTSAVVANRLEDAIRPSISSCLDLGQVVPSQVSGRSRRAALAPVSANTPYNSLKRLQADGVVAKVDYATYRFEDDAFAEWVRQRDAD